MADRYTYLPSIGLLVILIWSAVSLAATRVWQQGLSVVGAAAITLCAVCTRSQIGYWNNSNTLFEHAVAVTKDNYIAEENLASALNIEGRFEEAFVHIREALRIKPDYPVAHSDMGGALLTMGRVDEAIRELQTAIRMDSRNGKAHSNLGAAYGLKGQVDDAVRELQIAVELDPANGGSRKNLEKALDLQRNRPPQNR